MDIKIEKKKLNNHYIAKSIKFLNKNTVIYVGIDEETDDKVIIKEILNKNIKEGLKEAEKYWENECQNLKMFKCNNSVEFLGKFKQDNSLYIVMEYCDCDLNEFINELIEKKKNDN